MKKEISGSSLNITSVEKLIDELQNDQSITELKFGSVDSLSPETAKILMDYLKTDTSIKSLSFSTKNNPSDRITIELGEMLKVNSTLESLYYHDYSNNTGSYNSTAIDEALRVNTTLTTLSVNHYNHVTGDGLAVNNTLAELIVFNTNKIPAGLKFNKGLTSVSFGGLTDGAAYELGDILKDNNTIKTLGFATKEGSILTKASGLKLAEGLQANNSINNLSFRGIGSEVVAQIALILKDTDITTLSISGKYVGPLAAKNIATALESNCSLKSLYLDHEANIGIEGYKAIGEALMKNNGLESISIENASNGGVPIGELGNKLLENILKTNNTLKTIDFYGQQIVTKDAKGFGQGLEANNALATLNLGYNKLGSKEGEGTYFFSKALAVNINLIDLNLSSNNLQLLDGQQLGKALAVNKGLKTLNLSSNGELKDTGVKYITDALYFNNTLNTLDVNSCGTTHKTAEEAAVMLKDNKTVKKLVLGVCTLYDTLHYNARDIHKYNDKAANLIKKYLDRNNGVVTDEEKQKTVGDQAPLENPLPVQANPSGFQGSAQVQPEREREEEHKEDGNRDRNNYAWKQKYLESKAKNKAKKLELQQQNKALQDELKKAQEDKFSMMMTMFNLLKEEKDAQKQMFEKTIIDQKVQSDELKGLFKEMLGMKDDKIKELEAVDQGNSVSLSFSVIDGGKSQESKLLGESSDDSSDANYN